VKRFAKFVFAGGLVLLAGLWAVELTPAWGPLWRVGLVTALVGTGSLLYGIASGLSGPEISRR
jgi:hypothetical protein